LAIAGRDLAVLHHLDDVVGAVGRAIHQLAVTGSDILAGGIRRVAGAQQSQSGNAKPDAANPERSTQG
jgi:hypothetical protein